MRGVDALVTEAESDPAVQIENTLAKMREDGRINASHYAVIVFASALWKEGTKTNSLRIRAA